MNAMRLLLRAVIKGHQVKNYILLHYKICRSEYT